MEKYHGAISKETTDANMTYLGPVCVARMVLYVFALVFSGLFSFSAVALRKLLIRYLPCTTTPFEVVKEKSPFFTAYLLLNK